MCDCGSAREIWIEGVRSPEGESTLIRFSAIQHFPLVKREGDYKVYAVTGEDEHLLYVSRNRDEAETFRRDIIQTANVEDQ